MTVARRRRTAVKLAAVGALLLLSAGARWLFARAGAVPAELAAVMVHGPAKVPTTRLVDQHGNRVTSDELFAGGWSFLFLGFTSCQTVCPATLAQLAELRRSFVRQFSATPPPRFIFVSVDPQRDTPARLDSYLGGFHGDFIGATGDPAQIAALSDALTAFYRVDARAGSEDYGVVHSGEIYLLDPSGRVYARFAPPLDTGAIPRRVAAMMSLWAHAPERS